MKTMSPEEVYHIVNDSSAMSKFVLLDVRSRMEYVRGHLVSAYWQNPDSLLHNLLAMKGDTRAVIIYDADETKTQFLAKILSNNGVENFYIMSGGFLKWSQLGYPAAIQLVRNTDEVIDMQGRDITIAGARAMMSNLISSVMLIDVRPYPAFAEDHIEGAVSIPYVPLNEFVVEIEAQNISRNSPIIIYCDQQSAVGEKALEVMLRNDFKQVYLLTCDVAEWNLSDTDLPGTQTNLN